MSLGHIHDHRNNPLVTKAWDYATGGVLVVLLHFSYSHGPAALYWGAPQHRCLSLRFAYLYLLLQTVIPACRQTQQSPFGFGIIPHLPIFITTAINRPDKLLLAESHRSILL